MMSGRRVMNSQERQRRRCRPTAALLLVAAVSAGASASTPGFVVPPPRSSSSILMSRSSVAGVGGAYGRRKPHLPVAFRRGSSFAPSLSAAAVDDGEDASDVTAADDGEDASDVAGMIPDGFDVVVVDGEEDSAATATVEVESSADNDPEPRTSNREALRTLLEKFESEESEEIDYDAPHNPVRVTSGERSKVPASYAGNSMPEVDDECYLGKEAQFDECVDFDPLPAASSSRVAASFADEDSKGIVEEDDIAEEEEIDEEAQLDRDRMCLAAQAAMFDTGGERARSGPFPRPVSGAVLVAEDGTILGEGRSSYSENAVEAALSAAGIRAAPLREWCVAWPSDATFRRTVAKSTLYVTLEPSIEREGEEKPPITQLIELSGIKRVVIGCQDPIPECAAEGAGSLHAAGVSVTMGILEEVCQDLIKEYTELANTKVQRLSRQHAKRYGRPLGHLHCSVIDSDDAEAFARNGNSFGKNFGGQHLSYRDFGTYEIAPPPETVWAADAEVEGEDYNGIGEDEEDEEDEEFDLMEFEEEDMQESLAKNPMMPWYEQVDACIATFPKTGNGPVDDPSLFGRLKGLKWLATNGKSLPPGVERVLVMDATDLAELPLSNDSPNLPPGVDVEEFWKGEGRKPSRILLRHGDNAMAIAVAEAAARAAAAAAVASMKAKEAIETGDAELAAEAALECQKAAMASNDFIQKEIQTSQDLKNRLISMGVKVEVIKGSDPIDVMNYLGKRSGYKSVVWRAGCWGSRGVDAILSLAFQRVSAHLAVDAIGGKFWQLMLAERALQSACGPESKLKVYAEEDAINLEYCDMEDADKDCSLMFDGRPVRHVRLDARVAVIDEIRKKNLLAVQNVPMKKRFHEEEAPWFL